MNKVIIVFCEGDHDIAILGKLLSVHGYSPYKEKVKNFPKPLNKLYMSTLAENIIEDSEFKFQRPNKYIPYVALSNNETLIIFHNLGGDGNILNGNSESILDRYVELNDEAIRKVNKYEEINFRFLYFLDADEIGVSARLTEIKNLLEIENIEHHKIQQQDLFEVGCYVFHDKKNEEKKGKLEDLLLTLMKPNNDQIFEQSIDFINQNSLDRDRQKKLLCKHEVEDKYSGSIQFKLEKSIISVAGQLQFSGANNSVIISHSDYIRSEDIKASVCCNNIMELF